MGKTDFPPAAFTPTMLGYSGQGAFRYWCQTALPLVYDDSLSYYELLNKVVHYLNNVISDVSNVETNTEALFNAYNQLQEYVNTYFNGIDIQDEINNKLDEMASSGELTDLISPFLPDLIANWLSKHITPTTPVVDNTLTIAGAAADSKKVGDLFDQSLVVRDITPYIRNDGSNYIDLDEITEPGIYFYSTSLRKINAPDGVESNTLIVKSFNLTHSVLMQTTFSATRNKSIVIDRGVYTRYKNFGGWREWIKNANLYDLQEVTAQVKYYGNYNYVYPTIKTDYDYEIQPVSNGITYTCFEDGHINVTGTKTENSSFLELYRGSLANIKHLANKMRLGINTNDNAVYIYGYFYDSDWNDNTKTTYNTNTESIVDIPTNAENLILRVVVTGDTSTQHNASVFPYALPYQETIADKNAWIIRNAKTFIETDNNGDYVDLNKLTVPGSFLFETSLRKTNSPNDEINAIEVYPVNRTNSALKQVAYSITRTSTNLINSHVYERYRNFGGWTEWEQSISKEIIEIDDYSLKNFNSFDIIHQYMVNKEPVTSYGVTFTFDGNNVHVNGTKNVPGDVHAEIYRGKLFDYIKSGQTLDVKFDNNNPNIRINVYFYDANFSSASRTAFFINSSRTIVVPQICDNVIIWIMAIGPNGTSIDGWVYGASILTMPTGGGNVVNNNEFNYTVHNDTYNVTASPSISPLGNFILTSTGDTTDRTADIISLLKTTGVCRLGVGDFYINTGIDMPDNTSIIGSGRKTRLILDSSVTEGYTVSVGSWCSIDNLTVSGSLTNLPFENREIGTRDGIVELGDQTGFDSGGTFSNNFDKLSNLWVENFTGSGIKSYRNDGAASFLAQNIDIVHCGVGVNIELFSEFHSWENIRTRWCVYGCIMNGGNNLFSNCHFDTNIHGFVIDNSLDNLINAAHSSITNCTICHSDNNKGNAIEITGVNNGLVFSNCQIFFGKIVITNSKGVVITNFNFGNAEGINITNSQGIIINNNIFGSQPVVTKNNVSGLVTGNNITRNGINVTI